VRIIGVLLLNLDGVKGYIVQILFLNNQGKHYSSTFDNFDYINLLKSYDKSVKMCSWFPLFFPLPWLQSNPVSAIVCICIFCCLCVWNS
jgi:hypothetical protein